MKRLLSVFLISAVLLTSCTVRQNTNTPSPGSGTKTLSGTTAETVTEAETTTDTPGSSITVETNISQINKYGNIVLTIKPQTLTELGFETADVISVKIGDVVIDMPIGIAYNDVDSGEPVCRFKTDPESEDEVVLAVNSGNLASTLKIAEIRTIEAAPGYECIWAEGYDETTTVYLSMAEKQGFADEYRLHKLTSTRTNKREDYSELSDAEYANFRAIGTAGMGVGTLYRSSSPINPALNRNKEADAALLDALIRTVINMSDQEETLRAYPDYYSTNYSKCAVIALNMEMDYTSDAYREKLAAGYRYIVSNDGPYLIHCNEGKDRTGFAAAILECLMGADINEVVGDYMLTYYNFYGIGPESEQYESVAESNIKKSLKKVFALDSVDDPNVDLSECASEYLEGLGMSGDEISALKNNLGKNYGGLSNTSGK